MPGHVLNLINGGCRTGSTLAKKEFIVMLCVQLISADVAEGLDVLVVTIENS